jgi:hypothetical protein
MESGREMYVDPHEIRTRYQERFAQHAQDTEQACRGLGIDFYECSTDRPLERTLFEFLQSRMKRGRALSRRRSGGRGGESGGAP